MNNRVIKYRCWDKRTNKMSPSFSLLGEFLLIGGIHSWQHENGNDSESSLEALGDLVIMQYTGLNDKNGVEIYEGDLLRYPSDTSGTKTNFTAYEVFFHDGDANSDYNIGFSMSRAHHQGYVCGNIIPSFKPKTTRQMIVIGNIYSSPNLINTAKEKV